MTPRLRRSDSNPRGSGFDDAYAESIHIAIRWQVQCAFLRAASLASDKRENVQNRGNTAKIPGDTHESIFHAGMFFRQ
jgi:hypothetical protein